MNTILLGEIALMSLMGGLGLAIIRHDLRALEIPAIPVLALAGLGLLAGLLFPLPPLGPGHALTGAALGIGLGIMGRAWAQWRIGVPAFGGADIAILAGAGAMLGPFLFGPWIIAAVALALLGALLLPRIAGQRSTLIDDTDVAAIPFCPALILSWAAFALVARVDVLPATGLF